MRRADFTKRPDIAEWPRLTFYYGFKPAELARMPRWLVRLYAEKLEVLLAERMLDLMGAAAYPHLEDAEEFRAKVVSIARGGVEDGVAAMSLEQAAPQLAAMGIQVVMEGA